MKREDAFYFKDVKLKNTSYIFSTDIDRLTPNELRELHRESKMRISSSGGCENGRKRA